MSKGVFAAVFVCLLGAAMLVPTVSSATRAQEALCPASGCGPSTPPTTTQCSTVVPDPVDPSSQLEIVGYLQDSAGVCQFGPILTFISTSSCQSLLPPQYMDGREGTCSTKQYRYDSGGIGSNFAFGSDVQWYTRVPSKGKKGKKKHARYRFVNDAFVVAKPVS